MLKELFFKKASEKEDRDRIKKRYILGGFGIGKLLAMGLGSATAAATLKLKSNFSDLEDILSYKEKHNLPSKAVVRDLVRIRGYAEISVIYHVQIQTIRDWIQ